MADERAALIGDFGSCFYIWHSDAWRACAKDAFSHGCTAGTAPSLREQLDAVLVEAIPVLRAQLDAAEAAAARRHPAADDATGL